MKIKLALCVIIAGLLVHMAYQLRFSPHFLLQVLRPAAALKSSLPEHVYEALPILYKHQASRYDVSEKIKNSGTSLHQRFVEASYPMRVEKGAPIIVAFAEENMSAHCKAIEKANTIAVYDCTE
jgi:hypothetical protein